MIHANVFYEKRTKKVVFMLLLAREHIKAMLLPNKLEQFLGEHVSLSDYE